VGVISKYILFVKVLTANQHNKKLAVSIVRDMYKTRDGDNQKSAKLTSLAALTTHRDR